MIPLKPQLLEIVMVSVLRNLTRNITNQEAIENHSKNLKNNLLIRNPRGLIRSPTSLKGKISSPNKKPLLTTKKPHATSVERKVILQNFAE